MRHSNGISQVFLLVGIILFLAGAGCGDTMDPHRPRVNAGRIQGRVTSGGLPVNAVVQAVPIVGGVAGDPVFMVEPSDDGWYTLDAPDGTYIVRLDIKYSGSYYDFPETLSIDCDHPRSGVDFDLGGLTLELFASELLDDAWGMVRLHRRDAMEENWETTYVFHRRARINNGRLYVFMSCLLPGQYQIEIILDHDHYPFPEPGDGDRIWMPGKKNQTEAQWYTVAADSISSVIYEFPQEPGRIEGTIGGAWLELDLDFNPKISLFSPDSLAIRLPSYASDDGYYSICQYFPEPVKVLVSHYGIDQWIGGSSFEDATIFAPHLGETISGVGLNQCGLVIGLDAASSLSGDAIIKIYDPSNAFQMHERSGYLNPSYTMAIPNLVPGSYIMQVVPNNSYWYSYSWRPQWFDRATEAQHARQIQINSPGEIVDLTLTLENGGQISGSILHDENQAANFIVVAVSADGLQPFNYAYSGFVPDSFHLKSLPDGEFKIGAFALDDDKNMPDTVPETTIWYPGTKDVDLAEVVEILDASVVTGLVIDVR